MFAEQERSLHGRGYFSFQTTAILVYDPTGTRGNQQLIWVDRAGS